MTACNSRGDGEEDRGQEEMNVPACLLLPISQLLRLFLLFEALPLLAPYMNQLRAEARKEAGEKELVRFNSSINIY